MGVIDGKTPVRNRHPDIPLKRQQPRPADGLFRLVRSSKHLLVLLGAVASLVAGGAGAVDWGTVLSAIQWLVGIGVAGTAVEDGLGKLGGAGFLDQFNWTRFLDILRRIVLEVIEEVLDDKKKEA